MVAKTRVLRLAAILVTTILTASCGSSDDDREPSNVFGQDDLDGSDSNGPEAPVDPDNFVTSWTFAADDCPLEHPIPLTVSTEVEEERPYVRSVVACTSDEQYGPVWLHNVGDEIWRYDDDGAESEFVAYTPESVVFAEGFGDPPILVPGDKLVANAPPSEVSWTLDGGYTIAWDTQSEAVDQLQDKGEAALVAAIRRKGTPQRAALTACTLSAYKVADDWAGDPDGFSENFAATLTASASTAGCAAKWETAWKERFQPTATFLETADSRFRVFTRIGRNFLIAIR